MLKLAATHLVVVAHRERDLPRPASVATQRACSRLDCEMYLSSRNQAKNGGWPFFTWEANPEKHLLELPNRTKVYLRSALEANANPCE